MGKKRNKLLACGLVASVLALNVLVVSAQSESKENNGVGYQVYSNITATTANAGTVSASSSLYAEVSSTYVYRDASGGLKDQQKSSQATAAATVSFTVPSGGTSVSISSEHITTVGGNSEKSYTGATYIPQS